MTKQDELDLWNLVKDIEGPIWWPNYFKKLGISERRAYYIQDKWIDIGILHYGGSLRTVWIEDKSKWKE